ncbi:MAG: ABC transporter ATP-binding protein [Elusimicrobia bacterium]|nr:ABC transporter ATP-binding protein [Elusimicrobiota bacterium]
MTAVKLHDLGIRFRTPHAGPGRGIFRRYIYKPLYALERVNLSVEKGEAVGIIGENGSGKTTLLSAVAGILRPDTGAIEVNGRVSGILGLGIGCKPKLSARDNIFLYASMLGIRNRDTEKKFDEIVRFAGIEDFTETKLANFSSGMLLRFGFSVAVNVDPDILLLDEVLSVGDEAFREKSYKKISEFRRQGKTIMVVSHGLGEIASFCDRLVLLDKGRVRKTGSVREVIDEYLGMVSERSAGEDSAVPGKSENSMLRWGTKEVKIEKVALLGAGGEEAGVFYHGGKMVVRMHYNAQRKVKAPVFGLAVYDINGREIDGPNTRADGYAVEYAEGEGYIDYIIDNLPLYDGEYLLSVSVYDHMVKQPFDHHDRMYKFLVTGKKAWDRGIVRINARWEHKI